jgi:hypothetical protein
MTEGPTERLAQGVIESLSGVFSQPSTMVQPAEGPSNDISVRVLLTETQSRLDLHDPAATNRLLDSLRLRFIRNRAKSHVVFATASGPAGIKEQSRVDRAGRNLENVVFGLGTLENMDLRGHGKSAHNHHAIQFISEG